MSPELKGAYSSKSRCSRPYTRPLISPTLRIASNTPGMKDTRSNESCRIVSV